MNTIRPIMVGVALALCAANVGAQIDAETRVRYEIKSQVLRDALNEWAQQTGFQLISPSSDVTSQVVVKRVSGRLSPRAALEALLAGTSLTYELLDARTVVIRERPKSVVATSWRVDSQDTKRQLLAYTSAQTESTVRVAQTDTPSASPAANMRTSGRSATERDRMEEVIVTAQKREEQLQDVPISISVVGGPELDTSTAQGVTETLNSIPSVTTNVGVQGGGTQVTIRGVTAASALATGSSPVAYYLDSTPFGFVKYAIAPDANAYDLERIEVLRGPQGTLYGATALNGVVRVLTHPADLDEFGFKARTSGSATKDGGENFRADMALNVPIVPGTFAARAVVGYQDLSGWIDRPNREDANDAEIMNARLRLDAQPTEALSIGLSAWLSRSDYGAPSVGFVNRTATTEADEPYSTDYDVLGLRIGYDFSAFSIASSTSYIDYANHGVLSLAPYGLPAMLTTNLDSEVFAQEIVLNSSGSDSWRWSLGGMYRRGEDRIFQWRTVGYVAPTDQIDTSESIAIFGELTKGFFDGRLELTAGVRYFEDDVSLDERSRVSGVPPEQLFHTKDKFDAVSPRVVLSWHPQEQTTLYASYSEGFRSGAGQQPAVLTIAPQFPPVDADTLRNYEIGAKSLLADGRLSLDFAVYYIDWKDVQQSLTVQVAPGVSFQTLVNGESASGMGVDVGITVEPVDDLNLSLSFGWNDLQMDEDVLSDSILLFNAGDRLNLSPEYTISGAFAYTFPLGSSGFEASFSASATYVTKQDNRTIFLGTFYSESGDEMLIGRAGFTVRAPEHWSATLFVDNINDEDGSPVKQPFPSVATWDTRVRPRTAGLQIEYRF